MRIGEYTARVSRWRGHIMGFATLCILFFHSEIRIGEPWNYFFNLLWGVDIFFFCTGLGVHRSLSHESELTEFYKRRFRRIYPVYLPLALLFFVPVLVYELEAGAPWRAVQELMGNVLMLGWINELDYQFNWYPQAVMLVYLVSPVLFAVVRRYGGSGRALAALFGFFIVSQPCFFNQNLLILYSRMPCFLMGLICAELTARESDMKLNRAVLAVLFLGGNLLMYYGQRFPTEILWGYGLSWYPGILIVPGALWLLPWAFEKAAGLPWLKWLLRALDIMGKWSFEIFLVHLLLCTYINVFGMDIKSNLLWLLLAAAAVLLAVGYGKLISRVTAKPRKANS